MVSYALCIKYLTLLTLTVKRRSSPIQDAFSFIRWKEKLDNPSVWEFLWGNLGTQREAMRAKMPRSFGKLNEHAPSLPPLPLGYRVFLQSQQGPHPSLDQSLNGETMTNSVSMLTHLCGLPCGIELFMQVHPCHSCDRVPPQPAPTVYKR